MRHEKQREVQLLLVLVAVAVLLLGSGSSTLALDTTGAASAVRRSEGKVNVLLGVETDNERGNVDNLLANTDADVRSRFELRRAKETYRMWR